MPGVKGDFKFLTTDHPLIVFEDNDVGHLKKKLFDASEAEIDRILQLVDIVGAIFVGILLQQSCGKPLDRRLGPGRDPVQRFEKNLVLVDLSPFGHLGQEVHRARPSRLLDRLVRGYRNQVFHGPVQDAAREAR